LRCKKAVARRQPPAIVPGLPLDLPELTADYPDVALIPILSDVPASRWC